MRALKLGIIFSLLALTSCAHVPEEYAPGSSAKFKREPVGTDAVVPPSERDPPLPETDMGSIPSQTFPVKEPSTTVKKTPSGEHGESGKQKLASKSPKATTDQSSVPENKKDNQVVSGTKGNEDEDRSSVEGSSREDRRRPRKYRRRYYDDYDRGYYGSRRRYYPGRYYDDYYSDSDSGSYESDEYYPYSYGRNYRRRGYRRGRYGNRRWRYGRSLKETTKK